MKIKECIMHIFITVVKMFDFIDKTFIAMASCWQI